VISELLFCSIKNSCLLQFLPENALFYSHLLAKNGPIITGQTQGLVASYWTTIY